MELSEVTLDVEVSGEGPAVLLVHGFPDSHRLWRHQVPALTAAVFRCVVPTLRGFGASDRPEGGPEAYHPAKLDQPEKVNDLLLSFLKENGWSLSGGSGSDRP
ncbi:alpha/beta fold hydrolase [Streptomyces sp. NPDC055103]